MLAHVGIVRLVAPRSMLGGPREFHSPRDIKPCAISPRANTRKPIASHKPRLEETRRRLECLADRWDSASCRHARSWPHRHVVSQRRSSDAGGTGTLTRAVGGRRTCTYGPIAPASRRQRSHSVSSDESVTRVEPARQKRCDEGSAEPIRHAFKPALQNAPPLLEIVQAGSLAMASR